ncbi:DUF302 domain-containing protein [Catalinimonas niigatensis]|uniref:DUF302 domain-containing protein n=1 Tax=Catalinimonas niigatensis TaxID=1397264 RepID=UPI00266527B9|nr:DUF302 domain-containing protein [Catalinimonas niigatensis]WPP49717.1 DUF302 domain-containing protein [Catalinimonas niigatensis]
MTYYFSKKLTNISFNQTLEKVATVLKTKGFGILTEIDVQDIMKKKLDRDIKPYKILGACNPSFAYQALQTENKIGTMLPCNVIVQELEDGSVEVASVDPKASMQAVENDALIKIAGEVQQQLQAAINEL